MQSFNGQNQTNFPAVFASVKCEEVSAKYQFVDTSKVVNVLAESGFDVRQVSQRGKGASAKHMVRLTNPNMKIGNGNAVEVIVRNAHNGTSSLNLMFGVYRFVCSNGLIVGDHLIQPIRVRHLGEGIHQAVGEALELIEEQRRLVAEQVLMMQNTTLSQEKINDFTKKALVLAFPEFEERHTGSNIVTLQQARRQEDNDSTVWQVYNTVQENIIRGGQKLEGMTRTLRSIRDLDRDFQINKGLWNNAIEIAKAA